MAGAIGPSLRGLGELQLNDVTRQGHSLGDLQRGSLEPELTVGALEDIEATGSHEPLPEIGIDPVEAVDQKQGEEDRKEMVRKEEDGVRINAPQERSVYEERRKKK